MAVGSGPVPWIGFFLALSRASFPHLQEVSLRGLRSGDPYWMTVQRRSPCAKMYFSRLLRNPAEMQACGGRFELRSSPTCWFRYPDVRYVGPPSSMSAVMTLFGEAVSDIMDIARDSEYWSWKLRELGDRVTCVYPWPAKGG